MRAPIKKNRGFAAQMLKQGLEIAKELGLEKILCVCNENNYASEKVIINNGGIFENKLFDNDEKVLLKDIGLNFNNF